MNKPDLFDPDQIILELKKAEETGRSGFIFKVPNRDYKVSVWIYHHSKWCFDVFVKRLDFVGMYDTCQRLCNVNWQEARDYLVRMVTGKTDEINAQAPSDCPECAASLRYDPDTNCMKCSACGLGWAK